MKQLAEKLVPEEEEEEDMTEEMITWQKIVGTRRKSMGPQFSMTHFNPTGPTPL